MRSILQVVREEEIGGSPVSLRGLAQKYRVSSLKDLIAAHETYVFSVESIEILNQKADTDHSDNDYLSLVLIIGNTATKNVQTLKSTQRVGGILHTGDVVPGPFKTEPFHIGDDDVLTVSLALVNLGSSDAEEQFHNAEQVTQNIVDKAAPAVGAAISTIMSGEPLVGAAIGEGIAQVVDKAVSVLSDVFDFFGIHAGPPNCNGEVFHDTLTYGADEFRRAINQPASRTKAGPQTESRCGAAPHTTVNFRIRRAIG